MNNKSYTLKEDSTLCFLHIPKTAGTSLTAFLDAKFSSQNIFPYQKWPDLLHHQSNFNMIFYGDTLVIVFITYFQIFHT